MEEQSVLVFLDRQRRGRRRGLVRVGEERKRACLRVEAWCMRETKERTFVWRSRRCRIVDRFVTSHDGVEGCIRLRRLVVPMRRGREARIVTAWWQCWEGEGRMERRGTSQVKQQWR